MMRKQLYQIGLMLTLAFAVQQASANSFQLWQQSGAAIGDDAAGAAAIANDGTTAYYNPAGLTRIKRQNMAISMLASITNVKFKGTLNSTPAITGFTNSGSAQGGESNVLPTILYGAPINDKWAFGFSVFSPYENHMNFTRNAFTRYIVTESNIKTYDLSPSIAYRPFQPISIGFGIDAQRLKLEYDHIDTTSSTANDALIVTTMGNWAFGWNGGLLWEINPTTRIGLSYHSQITHHLSGNSRFHGNPGSGTGGQRAKTTIYLPPLTILSAYHEFNSKFALMGTMTYTQWTKMRDLTLYNLAGTANPENVTLQDPLRNSWRFVIGAHYKVSPKFLLRTGLGYTLSPTKDSTRNIMMPDANSYTLSLGMGYAINKTLSVDLGYSHIFVQHASINHTQTYSSEQIQAIGNLQQSADLIGIQLNWLMT